MWINLWNDKNSAEGAHGSDYEIGGDQELSELLEGSEDPLERVPGRTAT